MRTVDEPHVGEVEVDEGVVVQYKAGDTVEWISEGGWGGAQWGEGVPYSMRFCFNRAYH